MDSVLAQYTVPNHFSRELQLMQARCTSQMAIWPSLYEMDGPFYLFQHIATQKWAIAEVGQKKRCKERRYPKIPT